MKNIILFIVVLLVMSAFAATAFYAAGSSDDPLVPRSYVDQRFNELNSMIAAITANQPPQAPQAGANLVERDAVVAEVLTIIDQIYGQLDASGNAYQPVSVPGGSTLFGAEGTEIILRSGRAAARVPGQNGIIDSTAGLDLMNGAEISQNHNLIIPREDGRGVTALTDAWFIVRGEYTISQ